MVDKLSPSSAKSGTVLVVANVVTNTDRLRLKSMNMECFTQSSQRGLLCCRIGQSNGRGDSNEDLIIVRFVLPHEN